MRRLDWFRDRYLTIDPRALGVGRIVLATVLLLDLVRRVPAVTLWYSNLGLLPNHTVLWRPPFPHVFSLFFTASWPHEVALGFALCGAAYLCLLFGYRTRLAQVATLLAVLSLHGRVLFVQNSGDVVLVELCIWTLFLPLGQRYSVDARRMPPRDDRPVVSFAVGAIVGQLAVIYLFNAAQKNGVTWRDGTAVHYILYYANIVTPLGVWARSWMTPGAARFLTWSTRATEAALPILLFLPWAQRVARWLAIALVVAIHTGFALFLNLGIFVPAMVAFTPFLVPVSDWDRIERWWSGRPVVARLRAVFERWLAAFAPPARREAPKPRPDRCREVSVLALLAVATVGTLADNSAVTHVPPSVEPTAIKALRVYLQMFESWSLFAPNVATSEGTVAVDAITADGRHVDPLNEALSPGQLWLAGEIPARLGNSSFASAYLLRLPDRPDYFGALGEWLLRYPDRTGREADRITSFRVVTVEQEDPALGARTSRNLRSNLLFRYPN